LVKIAQTIDQASSSLKQGKPPHEECAKLQIYAEQFSKVVGELIPKDVVERLSMDLNDFGPSQELLEIYQSFQESAEYELVEASGILKALADTLIAAEIVH